MPNLLMPQSQPACKLPARPEQDKGRKEDPCEGVKWGVGLRSRALALLLDRKR
jgi:hypothetical protein